MTENLGTSVALRHWILVTLLYVGGMIGIRAVHCQIKKNKKKMVQSLGANWRHGYAKSYVQQGNNPDAAIMWYARSRQHSTAQQHRMEMNCAELHCRVR